MNFSEAISIVIARVREEMKRNPGIDMLTMSIVDPPTVIVTGYEPIDVSPPPTLDIFFNYRRSTRQPGYQFETVSGVRHRLTSLLKKVQAGQTFLITVRGKPIARLCPLREEVSINKKDPS